ncbi:pullulanase-type alpha-1,6-glucosidase [Colwellia demingiae]|uniref:Pullulanase-type alpha-1,6-glucosidase n=1 Tax=Colwellia demingiae TaxID=89401 RepID=A0A5C6QCT0_9GAMM|nr:pullulanase-type alpha-1,6-glucosidase [Colwellia demingiae]TWX66816.1 pullulanase-type alpha-1,6-glucosidase [Colwellia demingiae]
MKMYSFCHSISSPNRAVYIALSASLLVSACGETSESSQLDKQGMGIVAKTNVIKASTFKSTDLDNLPSDTSAHWLTTKILVLPKSVNKYQYQLLSKNSVGFNAIDLLPVTFPEKVAIKFPHLTDFQAFEVQLTPAQSKRWLKQQVMVVALDATIDTNVEPALNTSKQAKKIAYVQIGAVIDSLYTQGENDADEVTDLGAKIINHQEGEGASTAVSFKLWAPTAQAVSVQLFDNNLQATSSGKLDMVEDTNTGIWQVISDNQASYAYYKYQLDVYHPVSKEIESLSVTDPYSLSLSVNSEYSQVVDLNDAVTQPEHWLTQQIPTVKNVEDNVFYETHIRDFSANEKQLSNPKFKGKYKAFSEKNSDGIQHLKALQVAGLNNIHLLPTFDIATVNEDDSKHLDIDDNLAKVCAITPDTSICQQSYDEKQSIKSLLQSYAVAGEQAQQLVSELREVDNYNWGYDPFHYTVPEGSYAVDAKGVSRLVEFREMVQSLHGMGFRVIMDVVYNHTHQAGLEPNAVLDKIVPTYYHRLDPITGAIEQSTCCDNTATERVMMAKLMTDSLLVWARDYKIDGFRFDLMGHQPKDAMLAAREAVRQVDHDTYFYGEGWNFGEVASNSQFVQASQLELGGSEIGTFSDRLRDAVRGGGNNTRDSQGVGNGLLTFPNDKEANEKQNQAQLQTEYMLRMDQLRIGLAGNLHNFPLRTLGGESDDGESNGKKVLGKDIPYGDQPTGYALDPADTINYVSKHDNQTLWDNSQYRLPFDVSTEDRVRMHLQSLSFALFAQGIPFIHMGSEFMRSKSFLRDSYDYGDWFNRVDFSKQDNFYNVGLPPAEKDQANWPLIKQVLAGHQGRDHVNAKQIQRSSNAFIDMLAIRMSSPLFRLTTEQSIIDKVSFLNAAVSKQDDGKISQQQTGLLVMKIDDTQGEAVDSKYQSLIVIFNTSDKTQVFNYTFKEDFNSGLNSTSTPGYQLHPIQKKGSDEVVKQSKVTAKGFIVPPLSSVVFVKAVSE